MHRETDIFTAAKDIIDSNGFEPKDILRECTNLQHTDTVDVSDNLYEDSGLKSWAETQCFTEGGRQMLWSLLTNPVYNVKTLQERQRTVINLGKSINKIQSMLHKAAEYERDIIWILGIGDLQKAWPLNLLFPSTPIIKYINLNPMLLDMYHIYRCLISPATHAASPVATLFAPYIYLKKSMKFNISLSTYLHFFWVAVRDIMRASMKQGITKMLSLLFYVVFYVYGIYQSISYARMLYRLRQNIVSKARTLSKCIDIINQLHALRGERTNIPIASIKPRSTSVYNCIMNPDARAKLCMTLKELYLIDAYFVATKLLFTRPGWCVCSYSNAKPTRITGMGNVLLGARQRTNPCTLEKNTIVTGPNAAGKTTYTKSIVSNMILGLSLGVVNGIRATLQPVHAINSFMRINDTVGKESLFEAEVRRCSVIVAQAKTISARGRRAVYFLDEPMHSTPPLEGTAASYAVIEYLGKLPGVRVVITTHYHNLQALEEEYPGYFKNVSMEARPTQNGYTFSYQLKAGASTQSIALELLSEKDLDAEITRRAIEIKNKLSKHTLNAF